MPEVNYVPNPIPVRGKRYPLLELENDTRFLVRRPGSSSCIITTSSLADGEDGTPYSATVQADLPSTFSVTAGALPDGLTLNPDGTITGTPTLANPYTFTVQATPTGRASSCSKEFSINVLPNEPEEFEPPQLADLIFWLKPESLSGLSNNDPISPWPDSGTMSNDFSAPSAGTEPLYDAAEMAADFDGVNDRLSTAALPTTNTEYTMFVVLKFDTGLGSQTVLRVGDNGGGYGLLADTSNRAIVHRLVASLADGAANTGNKELWSAVRDSSPLAKFFLNGVEQAIGNSTSNVLAPDAAATLGAFNTAGAVPFAGLIYEVAVYQVALADVDRQAWETYLIDKHNPP